MADTVNALVSSDNENGTQSAEWTPVAQIDPDQKVLLGRLNPLSGTMEATWAPSSGAAVFKEKSITENGIYDPQQEGADGYSMVTVDIPTADMVKLSPIIQSSSEEAQVVDSSVYAYNDDQDRLAICGYMKMTDDGIATYSIVFSYPETFQPGSGINPGVHSGIISKHFYSDTYASVDALNGVVTVDTNNKTITLTLNGGSAPFQSNYDYSFFVWANRT